MAVRELAPGVHQIPLGGVNAFLIDDGDALTLIDAGLPKRDRRVLAALQGLGRRPEDVRDIVVSHYHIDHTGGLAALAAASGATVWAHAADTPVVRDGTPRPFPAPANPVARALTTLVSPFVPKRAAPVKVTGSAADGDELPVAGGLQVIHTPGHTPATSPCSGPARAASCSAATPSATSCAPPSPPSTRTTTRPARASPA